MGWPQANQRHSVGIRLLWFAVALLSWQAGCDASLLEERQNDQFILMQLKDSAENADATIMQSWQVTGKDPCTSWPGVLCSCKSLPISFQSGCQEFGITPGRVIGLDLKWPQHSNISLQPIQGLLPPELGSMSQLMYIDFSANKFSSIVPQQLANLQYLMYLSLANNTFITGTPPEFLGSTSSALREVHLEGNNLWVRDTQ